MNFGTETNTKAELCALCIVMHFASVRKLELRRIAGDSLVVINWIN